MFILMNIWMNDWEKFNETSLHSYSKLNMEDIADANYKHGKRVCTDFKIKKFG